MVGITMGTAVRLFSAAAGCVVALFLALSPIADERGAARDNRDGPPAPSPPVEALTTPLPASPLYADGSKAATVEAFVTESDGRAAAGVPILFSASAGTITPCAWTDGGGKVSVPFSPIYSPVDTNIAIAAVVPEEDDSILMVGIFEPPANAALHWEETRIALLRTAGPATTEITDEDLVQLSTAATSRSDRIVEKVRGVSIHVESPGVELPADGVSRTTLRALISGAGDGQPVAGVEVVFRDNSDNPLGSALSDAAGIALLHLTNPLEPGNLLVKATIGGRDAATTELTFSPPLFQLESVPHEMHANGASRSNVVALLRSEEGDPLPWVPVWFKTTAGTITSPVITDNDGRAVAYLTSGSFAGRAEITAGFSEEAAAAASVRFTRDFLPASIDLSADPKEIPADLETESLIKAALFDSTGDPVEDGTPVLFQVVGGKGQVEPFAVTAGGVASVRFRGITPAQARVRATACGSTEETEILLRAGKVSIVQLSSESDLLTGNGEESTSVSISIYDEYGAPLGEGEEIRLSASRGTIAKTALTDALGTARALYTADIGAGDAWITATAGPAGLESEGRLSIRLRAGPPAAILIDAVSNDEIHVQDSSPPGSATFIFTVVDANGVGVDTSGRSTVAFALVESPGAGERLVSSSSVTDRSGRVMTSVESGRAPGRMRVVASMETGERTIRSDTVEVRIGGFHPQPALIEIEPFQLNLPGLCFTERKLSVTARVFDQLGNPAPEGIVVYFSSDFGSIGAMATTDALGNATARFVSAPPHPVSTRGLVSLTATAKTPGRTPSASSSILLSGCTRPIRTDPATFAIADGGSQLFSYRLCDANENPLAPGTSVDVVTNRGTLAGDLAFVIPDVLSGHTDYTFYLADAIPGDDDAPADAFVTIMVTSPNGDLSTTISGSID